MKQISFKSAWCAVAPVLLLVLSALSTGCGPSAAERAEAARQDSIRIADSLARVEAARIEAARQDSIRTDSIIRAIVPQMKDFHKKQYGYYYLNDFNKLSNIMKKKGYNEETKSKYIPAHWDEEWGEHVEAHNQITYYWTNDTLVNIKVTADPEMNEIKVEFGNEFAKNLFIQSAKDAGYKNPCPDIAYKGCILADPKNTYEQGVNLEDKPGMIIVHSHWSN